MKYQSLFYGGKKKKIIFSVIKVNLYVRLQALLGGRSSAFTSQHTASVRRFKTFDLLQTQLLPGDREAVFEGDWYDYTASQFPGFTMTIRYRIYILKQIMGQMRKHYHVYPMLCVREA